jgi:eukaryotic-like serine/threonine-protein kinase
MAERGFAASVLQVLRGTGLDTSNGAEFIQQRVSLYAQIVAIIAFGYLVIRVVTGSVVTHAPLLDVPILVHAAGTVFIAAIWLICRRGRFSLPTLALLDAAASVVSSAAWAFSIGPRDLDTVYAAILATSLSVVGRSTLVPSKAGRTLGLAVLAHLPLAAIVWLRIVGAATGSSPAIFAGINQVVWGIAAIAVATINSRVIYDLRRSVREAKELGPYALEERLGAGGMGEVWRARHRFLVRAAAVKLIRPELIASGADPAVVFRRFEREARATAALRSPHTVQLYDFGQADDGSLFYVMEMLVGIDLDNLVSRFGPVPAERAIHILKQVCHSLSEAHQNGLTHRDIKPANIFVSCIGSELDFVKVLDFGLVRLQQDRPVEDQLKLTVEGSVAGTPAYSAPEVVLGHANYDHRVDIYAVGCVGYWLLTGKLVFDGDTPMQVMLDHARTPPPRPQTRTELSIPPELEQIIMDCLEKDPARRPASADALALRLSACPVPQQWTRERAERWWRSHLPEQVQARPVAEMLLAEETTPDEARELRPLRPAIR